MNIKPPTNLIIKDVQPIYVPGEPEPQFYDVTLRWTPPQDEVNYSIEVYRDDGFGNFSLRQVVTGVREWSEVVSANIGFSWRIRATRQVPTNSDFSNSVLLS